jgi:preprotein translocase subunit SecA
MIKANLNSSPGASAGPYPERFEPTPSWFDRTARRVANPFLRFAKTYGRSRRSFVRAVSSHSKWATSLSQARLREEAAEIGAQLRVHGFTGPLVAKAFSLVREAADRTTNKRHFDVQIIGGHMMLSGMIAEMETGEGKTLTATLPAATAALAGIPVHVITVNDYLTDRDAQWMGPVYKALGLTVGVIVHGLDPAARREAYRANVTYCTNKEVAFDYLKDRIVLGRDSDRTRLQVERLYEKRPRIDRLLLRGLHFGIVDEADSVLVDEARTPLIISGAESSEESERATCQTALAFASEMVRDRDFVIDGHDRSIRLLETGLDYLERESAKLRGVWGRRHWREQLVKQALSAQHMYSDGKQYLIRDGKIQIIDEYTGRLMPDRSWEHGLHQMIEVKEGCTMTQRTEPLARISYQRFFRRYLWLGGMTGTAREVAGELWSVYRLATRHVPTNRRSKREYWPTRTYATNEGKWKAVADRIAELHTQGRPVLVGTRSVHASEHISQLLKERHLEHQLLNARQDLSEAMIIAEAGQQGRITVATNMAGRGTDITLGRDVADLGGLHVIATELHEARRIDRQLFGRCGRQGDPGSCEAIVSADDELPKLHSHGIWKVLRRAAANPRQIYPSALRALNLRVAQRSAERLHRRMRRDLLNLDEHLDSTLAFSGRSE